ncbi:hypothetical protein LZK98_19025 [Sphingomonas cannabina]|uniref:hypothetical protein n=1 Tax=Sphingomonas cannabina TaxID=2899123 RepID=UPI001F1A98FD|nr:hypothetical protein [Sphingomonas cannabina]UIJ45111.1 hypothetical protein LZK98_19025 [Sphingomonas cannabina]
MKTSTLALAISAAVIAGWAINSEAQAPDPAPAPYQNSETMLSGWLEKNYSDMISLCLGGVGKLKLKRDKRDHPVSSIPKIISQIPDFSVKRVKPWASDPLTRIFAYVYKSSDTRFGDVVIDNGRYLADEYDNSEQQFVDDDRQLVTYESNCASSIKAAADLNSGFSLAAITLEGAGNSAINGNFNETASLTGGSFVSPIVRDWTKNGPARSAADQFKAGLWFWEWYQRNGVSTGNQLLYSIRGWMLSRNITETQGLAITGKVGGGISLPFLTGKSSLGGTVAGSSTGRVRLYRFMLEDAGQAYPQADYYPLPAAADVVRVMNATAVSRLVPTGDNSLRSGQQKTFQADVPMLPLRYCNIGWEIADASAAAGGIAILGAGMQGEGQDRACRFTFEYTAPASLPAGSHRPAFALQIKDPLLPAGLQPFKIPVRPSFAVGKTPTHVLQSNVPVAFTASALPGAPARSLVRWTSTIRVTDDNVMGANPQVRVDKLAVGGCSASPAQLGDYRVSSAVTQRTNTSGFLVTIAVEADYDAAVTSDWQNASCTVQGAISYQIDGTWVDKSFEPTIKLIVPSKPPAPAADGLAQ